MYAEPESVKYSHKDGKRLVRCTITSTSVPNSFPTTGAGIKGLAPEDVLDTGTTIIVTDGALCYMMDENGTFQSVG